MYKKGNNLDDCEMTVDAQDLRLGLARALDNREQDFADYNHLAIRSSHFGFSTSDLNVGPLNLTSRSDLPKRSEDKKSKVSGWVSYTSGWNDFEKEYEAIRGTKIDARWIRLLGLVRATIADDYSRGVSGIWMGTSAEGVDQTSNLLKIIATCLNDKKCDELAKSDTFKDALSLTPNTKLDYAAYTAAKTDDTKIRYLKNLQSDVQPYSTYYEPVKQRGVRLSDPNEITISLDSGDFRGNETELGKILEKFWKVGDNSVKIEWMTSTRDEPIFKFFFTPTPKAGSGIDFIRRTITIGQNAIESIPAHEIGRAMGFRPRYFSVWHSDSCKYEDESKPTDLLSDGRTGSIAQAHWDSLKKTYTSK
jgi:hypothetical protein